MSLERIVWGFGDRSTVPVFDTPLGWIGAVICWENFDVAGHCARPGLFRLLVDDASKPPVSPAQ